MAFLIRTGFWFSLVLLLIPFDAGSDQDGVARVGPLETFSAAREAVSDLSGMCERKPDVCKVGASAIHTVGVRAKEAARIAYEMLDEQLEEPEDAVVTGGITAIIEESDAQPCEPASPELCRDPG